jgi:SAM-dependent methyltransferase
MDHATKVDQEINFFKDMDLNALPEIYRYWANQHLVEFLKQAFDEPYVINIFAKELAAAVTASGNPTIISLGAGCAEIEELVAERMICMGVTNFRFECLELSHFLIERANERLAGKPAAAHIGFTEVDLTIWKPDRPFGAVFAHQSLHHIEALEHVFDQICAHLAPNGAFVTSDMIGRNGHMRWPETLAIIDLLWSLAPDLWKNNRPLARYEETFINHDCSSHGFEGIRAQDILSLLVQRFHFHKFSAWGGIIDPFTDRAFGHNLQSTNDFDRKFIDTIWETNRTLVKLGSIKPTQIVAVMKNEPCTLISSDGLLPSSCIRTAYTSFH